MRYVYYKILSIALLGSIFLVFTHCGSPFGQQTELAFNSGEGTNVYGGDAVTSYSAFEKTVYPITRNYCMGCHTTTQPLHASANLKTAHDAVINGFKVNFANIPASRLVAKLKDEFHNCWGDCADNATEMQQAIEDWNDQIKVTAPAPAPGPVTGPSPAPSPSPTPSPSVNPLTTSQSRAMAVELADPLNPLKSMTVRSSAETALVRAPMVRATDVHGTYVHVPNNGLNPKLEANDPTAGEVSFNFKVPVTGKYRIMVKAHCETVEDYEIFMSIVNIVGFFGRGCEGHLIGPRPQWNTFYPIADITLPAGNQTIAFRQRQDGFKLYEVVLTMEEGFDGTELESYYGVTLTYDISQISRVPGAKLKIDVSDIDPYTYKFSNPRIEGAASNVRIKGLKLLVNNVFNPQHSTYTLVDTIVGPTAVYSLPVSPNFVECSKQYYKCILDPKLVYEALYGVLNGGYTIKQFSNTNMFECNDGPFGGDPAPGQNRACYIRVIGSSAPQLKFSNASMLVLKDRGPAEDKISFSFEVLEPTTSTGTSSITPGGTPGSNVDPTSLNAFRNSVYTLSRNNCISCHKVRAPAHASDDAGIAHEALVNGSFINFFTPENSRIVQKLRFEHNCGTRDQCNALADQYRAAIVQWQMGRPAQ